MSDANALIGVGNLFSIKDKVALITGGSRGIGLMIAQGYVEAGAKVYISSRKAEVCDAVAAELSKIGTCISLPQDISTNEGCAQLVKAISEREERLDILVNNAGAAWGAPLAEYPESGWDKVCDLNMKSVFFLTQQLVPLLEASGTVESPAKIINVGSIDGIRVPRLVETYAYSASKAGVHQMTQVLALHLGKRHIAVNAIAPGPFPSHMTKELLTNFGDRIAASCPMGRVGQPEDMAGIAIFLASRAGNYLNGTVIPVDGGITL